jgi:hypothetical protein
MILRDFLGQLNQVLYQAEGNFGKKTKAYLRALGQIADNNTGIELSNMISAVWEREKTAREEFESLNQLILDSGKKVLVLVDDLDRLEKDELLETLRMIKILAAFESVLFVVAYDKKQAIDRLQEVYQERATEYLQKIFAEEVSLPPTTPPQLWDVFSDSCKRLDPNASLESLGDVRRLIFGISDDVEFESLRFQMVINRSTWQIKSAREAGMIAQNFIGLVFAIGSEIQSQDLLLVSILRVRYPSIFERIRSESLLIIRGEWVVFGQENDVLEVLLGAKGQDSKDVDRIAVKDSTLEDCSPILEFLFPKNAQRSTQFWWNKEAGEKRLEVNRINWKRNLNLLLQLSFHRSFDSAELRNRINGELSELKVLIFDPKYSRSIADIRLFLSNYLPEKSTSTTVRNFIWLNLHIIDLGLFQNLITQEKLFGTNHKQLLIQVFGSKWEKLPILVHEYLKEFKRWDRISSTFWNYFRTDQSERQLFDGDKLFWVELNEIILETYLKSPVIDYSIAIVIFQNCVDILDENDMWHASRKSCKLIKQWAEKDRKTFLANLVQDNDQQYLYYMPFLWDIFSNDEFEKFIKGWEFEELLLDFIEVCKQAKNNAIVFPKDEQIKKYGPLTSKKKLHYS